MSNGLVGLKPEDLRENQEKLAKDLANSWFRQRYIWLDKYNDVKDTLIEGDTDKLEEALESPTTYQSVAKSAGLFPDPEDDEPSILLVPVNSVFNSQSLEQFVLCSPYNINQTHHKLNYREGLSRQAQYYIEDDWGVSIVAYVTGDFPNAYLDTLFVFCQALGINMVSWGTDDYTSARFIVITGETIVHAADNYVFVDYLLRRVLETNLNTAYTRKMYIKSIRLWNNDMYDPKEGMKEVQRVFENIEKAFGKPQTICKEGEGELLQLPMLTRMNGYGNILLYDLPRFFNFADSKMEITKITEEKRAHMSYWSDDYYRVKMFQNVYFILNSFLHACTKGSFE